MEVIHALDLNQVWEMGESCSESAGDTSNTCSYIELHSGENYQRNHNQYSPQSVPFQTESQEHWYAFACSSHVPWTQGSGEQPAGRCKKHEQ